MYRITRTIIRGPYANDSCFTIWMASQGGLLQFVKVVDEPLNNGGPNDKRLYLWNQLQEISQLPNCPNGNPSLVTNNGANGWPTLSKAEEVLKYELGQGKVIADNVAAANQKAVSPGNIASGVASDVGKAAGDALDVGGKAIDKVAPVLILGGLVTAAVFVWRWLRGK